MTTPSDTIKTDNTEIEQILNRLIVKNHGLPISQSFNVLMPNLDIQEAKAALETLITQRCREARIDEVKKIWSHAREHTITDIEMIEHHTGLDFIEAVDTKHLEDRIAALNKEEE